MSASNWLFFVWFVKYRSRNLCFSISETHEGGWYSWSVWSLYNFLSVFSLRFVFNHAWAGALNPSPHNSIPSTEICDLVNIVVLISRWMHRNCSSESFFLFFLWFKNSFPLDASLVRSRCLASYFLSTSSSSYFSLNSPQLSCYRVNVICVYNRHHCDHRFYFFFLCLFLAYFLDVWNWSCCNKQAKSHLRKKKPMWRCDCNQAGNLIIWLLQSNGIFILLLWLCAC